MIITTHKEVEKKIILVSRKKITTIGRGLNVFKTQYPTPPQLKTKKLKPNTKFFINKKKSHLLNVVKIFILFEVY